MAMLRGLREETKEVKDCIVHGGPSRCGSPRGYRIQSDAPVRGALWPRPGERQLLVEHHCIAMALAAKCEAEPGCDIQVVHVDSGEVVFRKPSALRTRAGTLPASEATRGSGPPG